MAIIINADDNELDILHQEILKQINTMYVGIITKINNLNGTLNIKLSLSRSHRGVDTSDPELLDVPFVSNYNGKSGVLLPMKVGDLVSVIFSSRRIDEALSKKSSVRVHNFFDFNQCLAIPNISVNDKPTDLNITGDDLQIINSDGNIKITGKTVLITADTIKIIGKESVAIGGSKVEIFTTNNGTADPNGFVNINGVKMEGMGSLSTILGNLGAPLTYTPTPPTLFQPNPSTPSAPPKSQILDTFNVPNMATLQANLTPSADGSLKAGVNAGFTKLNAQHYNGQGSTPLVPPINLIP